MIKSGKNYYEILGVTPDVTSAELKSVYRKLVRKYHPDINPDGEILFKDITKAYETLCDEKLRKQYDTINGIFKTTSNSSNEAQTYRKTFRKSDSIKNTQNTIHEKTVENSSNTKSDKCFTDVINNIIDGFSQASKRNKKKLNKDALPVNGEDVYADVVLTFKEALEGAQKTVNLVHTNVCPNCCGRKFINNAKCPICGGKGEVSIHEKINVTIPANVKQGAKLRLAGEGKKGVNGGKNGNLYLKISIVPDSLFKISGDELLCELPISPFEAVLGGDIRIPFLGKDLVLNLPPLTHSGQVFRLSAKKDGENNLFGDIIVTVKIQIPEKLSEAEIDLYKKLSNISDTSLRENL